MGTVSIIVSLLAGISVSNCSIIAEKFVDIIVVIIAFLFVYKFWP